MYKGEYIARDWQFHAGSLHGDHYPTRIIIVVYPLWGVIMMDNIIIHDA